MTDECSACGSRDVEVIKEGRKKIIICNRCHSFREIERGMFDVF